MKKINKDYCCPIDGSNLSIRTKNSNTQLFLEFLVYILIKMKIKFLEIRLLM